MISFAGTKKKTKKKRQKNKEKKKWDSAVPNRSAKHLRAR